MASCTRYLVWLNSVMYIEDVYKLLELICVVTNFTLKIFNQYLQVFLALVMKVWECSVVSLSVFLLQPCWTSGKSGASSREYLLRRDLKQENSIHTRWYFTFPYLSLAGDSETGSGCSQALVMPICSQAPTLVSNDYSLHWGEIACVLRQKQIRKLRDLQKN